MSIDLKNLKPHHRGMARAQVAFGMKVGELAEKFSMTPQQITNITLSPLYRAEVARLERGADGEVTKLEEELKALAIRAVEIVAEDLMHNEKTEHRTRVAFSVLDRTGYAKNLVPQDNRKQKIGIGKNNLSSVLDLQNPSSTVHHLFSNIVNLLFVI